MDREQRIKLSLCLLFFSFFFASVFAEQINRTASQTSLSLEQAIITAFKNNKDIQIQKEEMKVAKAGILQARSAFLPKLNLDAAYKHTGDVLNLSSSSGGKKDSGVLTGYRNDNAVALSLGDVVYNGGANIADFKQALLEFDAQKETLRAKKLDVEFEMKRLYYGLLLAFETLRIARDLLGQAKEHYEDVKRKFDQGTASRFDLLQSNVQVSKVFPEVINAENSVYLIMAEMNKLLGFDVKNRISPIETLSYSPVEIREDDFLKQAYLYKPEMILKSLGIDISKWGIQSARAANRPQIDTDLAYSYRSNDIGDMFNRRHSNWNAGVSISIPIFDGFSSRAKVEQAKVYYAQAILAKANLSDQIAVDIRQACLDLEHSRAIIDSQEANVDEAKEALKISELRYDSGVGTNLDVLDSQVSLSQIEQNLSEGIYDYIMAKAFLDRTMGSAFLKEEDNDSRKTD